MKKGFLIVLDFFRFSYTNRYSKLPKPFRMCASCYDSEAKKHTTEPTPPQQLSILEHQLRLVFYHKFLKIQMLKLNFLTDSSDSGKLAMSRMHSSGHLIHTADPITI